MLVRPHLSRLTESSSCLINNEWNAFILRECSQALVEVWRGLFVLETSDWFNYHGGNVFAICTSSLNDFSVCLDAAVFLFAVSFLMSSQWVLELGERCLWPIISWEASVVNGVVTAAESSNRLSVRCILKTKNRQVLVVNLVVHGVFHDSSADCDFIGSRR
jgi:hypothetical protein